MNVTHRCGCPIERLYSFESGIPLYVNALNREIHTCPQCGEPLCDTDMHCADGEWLSIYQQTLWSVERRAAWDKARIAQ